MPDNLNVEMSQTDLIRQLIAEEQDAVISYTERAEQVDDPLIRQTFLDIAQEEKVHSGELMDLLSRFDPQEDDAQSEGGQEVDDLDETIEKAWDELKRSRLGKDNRTSVEDKLDVLLAQNQEIQVDTARTAELVPAVMGSTAEGTEPQTDELMRQADEDADGMTSDEDAMSDEDPYAMLDDLDGLEDANEGTDGPAGNDVLDVGSDGAEGEGNGDSDDIIDEGEETEGDDVLSVGEDADSGDVADEGDEDSSDVSDIAYEGQEAEGDDEEEMTEQESLSETDEDKDKDKDKDELAKARASRPTTRTIKSFETPVPYRCVSPVDRPPYEITAGHASGYGMVAKAIENLMASEPVDFGYGTDPHEVVRKDREYIKMLNSGIFEL